MLATRAAQRVAVISLVDLPHCRLECKDTFQARRPGWWCTRYQFDGGPPLQVPDPECLSRDPVTGATLGTLDTLGGDGASPGPGVAAREPERRPGAEHERLPDTRGDVERLVR